LKTFKILKCSKVFYLNSKSKNVQKWKMFKIQKNVQNSKNV
jgi:hypothetical protein